MPNSLPVLILREQIFFYRTHFRDINNHRISVISGTSQEIYRRYKVFSVSNYTYRGRNSLLYIVLILKLLEQIWVHVINNTMINVRE